MESKQIIINLDYIEDGLTLTIDAKEDNTLFVISDASENGEAENQIVEGCFYDYELSKKNYSIEKDQIIQPRTRQKYLGTISPNIYVGTLRLNILKGTEKAGSAYLEVRSVKADYRND